MCDGKYQLVFNTVGECFSGVIQELLSGTRPIKFNKVSLYRQECLVRKLSRRVDNQNTNNKLYANMLILTFESPSSHRLGMEIFQRFLGIILVIQFNYLR